MQRYRRINWTRGSCLFLVLCFLFLFVRGEGKADNVTVYSYTNSNLLLNGNAEQGRKYWSSVSGFSDFAGVKARDGVNPRGNYMFGAWSFKYPTPKLKLTQTIYLRGDFKTLSEEGQLRLGGRTYFYNNDNGARGGDYGWLTVYMYRGNQYLGYYCTDRLSGENSYEKWTKNYIRRYRGVHSTSTHVYNGSKEFYRLNGSLTGVDKLYVVMEGWKESPSGSTDCDVYFDDMAISLVDDYSPYVENISFFGYNKGEMWSDNNKKWDKTSFKVGDTLCYKVKFSETVNLEKAKLAIDIGGNKVHALPDTSKGIKQKEALFTYTLQGDEIEDTKTQGAVNNLGKDVKIILDGTGCFKGIKDLANNDLLAYKGAGSLPSIKFDNQPPYFYLGGSQNEEYRLFELFKSYTAREEFIFQHSWLNEELPTQFYYTLTETENKDFNWSQAEQVQVTSSQGSSAIKLLIDKGTDTLNTIDALYLAFNIKDQAGNIMSNKGKVLRINKSDLVPPVITFTTLEHYTKSGVTTEKLDYFYGYRTKVNVMDKDSGVKEAWYRIQEGAWQKATLQKKDNEEFFDVDIPSRGVAVDSPVKTVALEVKVHDKKDNTSVSMEHYGVDRQAPIIKNFEHNPIKKKISWDVMDREDLNKVVAVKYAMIEQNTDDSANKDVDLDALIKTLGITSNGDASGHHIVNLQNYSHGSYKVYIWAEDAVGNAIELNQQEGFFFSVDKTGPVASVIKVQGNQQKPMTKALVTFGLVDMNMPITSCYYQFSTQKQLKPEDNDKWVAHTELQQKDDHYEGVATYHQPNIEDELYLFIKSTDACGNESIHNVLVQQPIVIDTKSPRIKIKQGLSQVYAKEHQLDVEVIDENELEKVSFGWSRDKGVEPEQWRTITSNTSLYTCALNEHIVPKDGAWFLYVKSVDECGNETKIVSDTPLLLDVTGPKGKIQFENIQDGGYTYKDALSLQISVEEEVTSFEEIEMQILIEQEEKGIEDLEWSLVSWKPYRFANNIDLTEGQQYIYVRLRDQLGNLSEVMTTSVIADYTKPIVYDVMYSEVGPTTEPVLVELEIDGDSEAINTINGPYYEFKKNGTFTFIIRDVAGNMTRYPVEVTNIVEQVKADAKVTYSAPISKWSNESITATLEINESQGWMVTSEGGNSHEFTQNGEHVFTYEDGQGHYEEKVVGIKNIDKTSPNGNIHYAYGNNSPFIIAHLQTSEGVTITNNKGSNRHIFQTPGSFTFEFIDKAGNPGSTTANVTSSQVVSLEGFHIEYDKELWTKEPVKATLTIPDEWSFVAEHTTGQVVEHIFSDNGDVEIKVERKDDINEQLVIPMSVWSIDKTAPNFQAIYEPRGMTKENVTVRLLVEDERSVYTTSSGVIALTFAENTSKTVEIKDQAGNVKVAEIRVNNIDHNSPVAKISYEKYQQDMIEAKLYLEDESETQITNNNGNDSFIFNENGEFIFEYEDALGNQGSTTAKVDYIISRLPDAYLSYRVGERVYTEKEFQTMGPISESVTVKIDFEFYNTGCHLTNEDLTGAEVTFTENGFYEFTYEDRAGYRGRKVASVTNIDKAPPRSEINQAPFIKTREDITVNIQWDEKVIIREVALPLENYVFDGKSMTFIATENMEGHIIVGDEAGNEASIPVVISQIDRQVPVGQVIFSTTRPTKELYARLQTDEKVRMLEGTKQQIVITENGQYNFIYEDMVGNKGETSVDVDWIDYTPPKVEAIYSTKELTNEPVEVQLKSLDGEPFTVKENLGSKTKTFYGAYKNYTFHVADEAGNETEVLIDLSHMDVKKPVLTLNGESKVYMGLEDIYEDEGAIGVDDRDGDISNKVTSTIVGDITADKYQIRYEVEDEAGNVAYVIREIIKDAKVPIQIYINGFRVSDKTYETTDKVQNLTLKGVQGIKTVKLVNGHKNQSYFKEGGTLLGDLQLELVPGQYTLYIRDQERRSKIVWLTVKQKVTGGEEL